MELATLKPGRRLSEVQENLIESTAQHTTAENVRRYLKSRGWSALLEPAHWTTTIKKPDKDAGTYNEVSAIVSVRDPLTLDDMRDLVLKVCYLEGRDADAVTLDLCVGKCRVLHHETIGQFLTCKTCGGPMHCGPYQHACSQCDRSWFERCLMCGEPRVQCTC